MRNIISLGLRLTACNKESLQSAGYTIKTVFWTQLNDENNKIKQKRFYFMELLVSYLWIQFFFYSLFPHNSLEVFRTQANPFPVSLCPILATSSQRHPPIFSFHLCKSQFLNSHTELHRVIFSLTTSWVSWEQKLFIACLEPFLYFSICIEWVFHKHSINEWMNEWMRTVRAKWVVYIKRFCKPYNITCSVLKPAWRKGSGWDAWGIW